MINVKLTNDLFKNFVKILKEQIDKEINNIPNEVVRIIKLFYDNNENLRVFEEKSSITI